MQKYIAQVQIYRSSGSSEVKEVWFGAENDDYALDIADHHVLELSMRDEDYDLTEVGELLSVERILRPGERLSDALKGYAGNRVSRATVFIFSNEVLA